MNAGLLVMRQPSKSLLYVEGWVSLPNSDSNTVIAHAWIRHPTLGDVDLTLEEQVARRYYPVRVMTRDEVVTAATSTRHWGAWSPELRIQLGIMDENGAVR